MKLILLNGCPAAGKSTMAKRLHKEMPRALLADVDTWRTLISGWQKDRAETLSHAYHFTVGAVDAYLQLGHSVIVDKAILSDNAVIDALIASGKKHKAKVFEFILIANKDIVVERAKKRGFSEKGLLTPEKVLELYAITQKLITDRPSATIIDTSTLSKNEVFKILKKLVL